jgi:hypothetical protein
MFHNLTTTPIPDLVLLATVALGAATEQIFSFRRGFPGAMGWLRRVLPGRSPQTYALLNSLLCVFLGSPVALFIFQPATIPAAVVVGLTWPSLLQRLVEVARAAENGE